MKKSVPETRDVVVVLRLSFASHRDILHGLSQAVRPHGAWRFTVIDYLADPDGSRLKAALTPGGVAGVVAASIGHGSVAAGLAGWNGPLVALGTGASAFPPPGRTAPFSVVEPDDETIGRRGADYLCSLGRFASFGFAMRASSPHSRRFDGFAARLAARGRRAALFALPGGGAADALGRWLRSLPKPAAVMAHADNFAVEILAAADKAGISVPGDLAVLGVDNDEYLCETAAPPLTSLAPDHVRMGEIAAEALRRRMEKPDLPADALRVSSVRAVERRSTKAVAPASALVERGVEFIRRNATRGIGASDVVAHLGVSPSLANLRFRQLLGKSVMSAVLDARLAALKRKLLETDEPAGRVALACGFRSEKHAMRLFKARFGTTMQALRSSPPGARP